MLWNVVTWLLQNGWTALHYACRGGHVAITELLIDNKVDVTATDNVSDYVAIIDFIYIY